MIKVLYLEDDPILGEGLKLNLELEGYQVDWFKNISDASTVSDYNAYDISILDLALPDGSGLDFCKKLRQSSFKKPILMLTAQLDEDTVVESLNSGANDYIKKPFSHKELLARIKVSLRRPFVDEEVLRFNGLVLNKTKRLIFFEGKEVSFNRKEFEILKIFIENAEKVITRNQLLDNASFPEDANDRTIDSHLSHIRTKLKKENILSVKIKSEYGVGYRMVKVV